MKDGKVFKVRFHAGGVNWPGNPFGFRGPGEVAIEPDFVLLRGSRHRSFRFPERREERMRVADIVNVRTSGIDVIFDVVDAQGSQEVSFSAADRDAATAVAALLPARRTPGFEMDAHLEREVFYDRMDYWSPSTPVTWALLLLNAGVFLLMWWQRHLHTNVFAEVLGMMRGGGFLDAMVRSNQLVAWGSNLGRLTLGGQWWRLLSSMFLHGFLLHLVLNMLVLWQTGALAERVYGSLRFLALYLVAGISGGLASVLWNPHVNSVGASGALLGIVGGLLAFIRRENSGVPPTVVKDMRGAIWPFILFTMAVGFLYPHTDNAAHLGGLLGGWLAGHLLARPLHVPKAA